MNARYGSIRISQFILVVFMCVFFFASTQSVGAAPEAPMVLSFSSWGTDKEPAIPAWLEMGKDLEEATKGKVKLKIYHAETLGKAKEHYEIALKGIADMAYLNISFTPGRFPITDLVTFSSAPSAEAMTEGLMMLMKKGYLNKEYENVKLLYVFTGGPLHLMWRKGTKPATSFAELKGKKIRIPGMAGRDLLTAVGATPVGIPMPDVYTALERGVVDAVFSTVEILDTFRLSHVSNEITRMNILTFSFATLMNKNTWEKLPKEAKDVLERNSGKYARMASSQHDRDDVKAIENNKPKIYNLPASDTKRFKEILAPSVKAYIEKYEAAGYPMKKAAKDYYMFMKQKYGEEPFILDF